MLLLNTNRKSYSNPTAPSHFTVDDSKVQSQDHSDFEVISQKQDELGDMCSVQNVSEVVYGESNCTIRFHSGWVTLCIVQSQGHLDLE